MPSTSGTYINDIPQWKLVTEIPTSVAIVWIRTSEPWNEMDEFIDLTKENYQRRLLNKGFWEVTCSEWWCEHAAIYLSDDRFYLYKWDA